MTEDKPPLLFGRVRMEATTLNGSRENVKDFEVRESLLLTEPPFSCLGLVRILLRSFTELEGRREDFRVRLPVCSAPLSLLPEGYNCEVRASVFEERIFERVTRGIASIIRAVPDSFGRCSVVRSKV